MDIETTVWKITDGDIVELKHDKSIYILKETQTIETKTYGHGIKQCYLEKWITNNNFTVFTLDMFYKAYPRQKKNFNLDRNISRLITDKKIIQLGKNKFKVIR